MTKQDKPTMKISKEYMLNTIKAIAELVDNGFGFDMDIKSSLANKGDYQFTKDEVIELANRFMDIYVLVHGFESNCCRLSKDRLIAKLLNSKESVNEE